MRSLMSFALAICLSNFDTVFCTDDDENVESPCPSKFQYSFRTPPLGLLRFTLDEVLEEVDVKVKFSIPGSGDSIGRLQLTSEKDVRLKNGKKKRQLKYKIRFPDVPFMPKLTLLSVNGKVRCKGPPYEEPEYSGIETITRLDRYFNEKKDVVVKVDTERPNRRATRRRTSKKKPSKKDISEEE